MNDISTATPDDAAEIGRILADGFHDDPVMCWVFHGDDDVRAVKLDVCLGFLANEANVPLGAAFMLDGGCACWTPPPGTDHWPDERSARFNDLLRRQCDGDDVRRLGVLSAAMAAVHPSEPHWYPGSIAAVRTRQGLGLGTTLLRHSPALVDCDQSPAYPNRATPGTSRSMSATAFV